MDTDTADYSQERYNEVRDEMINMLTIGWKPDFVKKSVPIIPISGLQGDNLLVESTKMSWWKGQDVEVEGGEKIHVHTALDALENMVRIPKRPADAVFRMPVSGIYKIKGVGDVITGRVEQGSITPGTEVLFTPTHTTSNACTGKIFTVEMHHKSVPNAGAGDNVGLNVKGLVKGNMPRVGDIMILKKDTTLDVANHLLPKYKFLTNLVSLRRVTHASLPL